MTEFHKQKPGNNHHHTEFKSNHVKTNSQRKIRQQQWNFPVDYNDHFETPLIAYQDINSILELVATTLEKNKEELIIYDPYYCEGSMVEHLNSLGYSSIINRNTDFYSDIKRNKVPEFDILLTNPPFSGEHKLKLLQFLSLSNKPFCILLPVYTATKAYWKSFVTSSSSSSLSQQLFSHSSSIQKNSNSNKSSSLSSSSSSFNSTSPMNNNIIKSICYLLPPDEYQYHHPEGTGHDVPPFFSAWFLGNMPFPIHCIKQIYQAKPTMTSSSSSSSSSSSKKRKLQDGDVEEGTKRRCHNDMSNSNISINSGRVCIIVTSVEELVTRGYVTEKRPNPKARKRLKMKMSIT